MPLFSTRSSPKRNSAVIQYDEGVSAQGVCCPERTCLSADSSSLHTLSPTDGIIITYFLPLTDIRHDGSGPKLLRSDEPLESEPKGNRVISKLPDYITRSFKIDPPLGFICVDNFTVDGTKRNEGKGRLPLLCAYSSKAAFVLDISYSIMTDQYSNGDVEGCVDGVIEPFETHLLSSKLTSVKILRIRAAPQSCMIGGGVYETLNPRGAMVMLTNEFSLVVHHGIGNGFNASKSSSSSNLSCGNVSVPLSYRTEEVQDGDHFVDFSFLPSSPKGVGSAYNAMTVALTTRTGSIFLASPILFHGTVIPRNDVQASMNYLEQEIARGENQNNQVNSIEGAMWRRNRAALQFLVDAFGSPTQSSQSSYYLTAKVVEGGTRCGTTWPVCIQGPLCTGEIYDYEEDDAEEEEDYENIYPFRVSCMEAMVTMLSVDSIAGVVLSGRRRSGHFLTYVMFPSGTNVTPRFSFESKQDADVLNHDMHNSAVVADKIFIDIGHDHNVDQEATEKEFVIVNNNFVRSDHEDGRDMALLLDPVNKMMIHHVSRYGIFTIISDAFEVTGRTILAMMSENKLDQFHHKKVKVNAWPSMEIVINEHGESIHGALSGAVVIGDAQFGHILVATLSKGASISVLNLSAAQYLHEAYGKVNAEKGCNDVAPSGTGSEDDGALKTMESIPPLHELIAPLFQKITMAVSNMSKVVGGATSPKEISAGGVANFLETKERCAKDVFFPLIELNGLFTARLKYLQDMRLHQEMQISQITQNIEALISHTKTQREAVKSAEKTSEMLINRSATILSAMRNKVPAITNAEREYFDQIRRCDAQCSKWASLLEQMDSITTVLRERIDGSAAYQLNLSSEQLTACIDLLNGQKVLLARNAPVLKECSESIQGILAQSGIA